MKHENTRINRVIKPIETHYKNYRFRSRTEARWAVWLETMDIQWNYEIQGYDLGSIGRYLPDFKIKLPWRSSDIAILGAIEGSGEFFFEVKPYENAAYNKQHAVLTKELDTPLLCVHGFPDFNRDPHRDCIVPKYKVFFYDKGELIIPDKKNIHRIFYFHVGENKNQTCLALRAHHADIYQPLNFFVKKERYRCSPHLEHHTPEVVDDAESIIAAYRKAMSARFEHGEQP